MKIALMILAAGLSERMGVLKPLLPVGEMSALAHAVALGRTERVHMITVVTGSRHELVEAELQRCKAKNVRHIYNKHYTDGMFTSIQAGVHSLPGDIDAFFLLPVDLCAITPDTFERLIAAYLLTPEPSVIYPTVRGERGHPPLIPMQFMGGLKEYDGPNGMQGYLSAFPSHDVEIDDPAILLDMDTPADYATLLRHLGLPTYPTEEHSRSLMNKYEMPDNIKEHSEQVCRVALKIVKLLLKKGVTVNEPLLISGCLLHDVARLQPEHHDVGAKLLLAEGYPDTAMLIAAHMDLPDGYEPDVSALSLLYLADKLSRGGQLLLPSDTLDSVKKRFRGNKQAIDNAAGRLDRAQAILDMLRDRYGIQASDILSG